MRATASAVSTSPMSAAVNRQREPYQSSWYPFFGSQSAASQPVDKNRLNESASRVRDASAIALMRIPLSVDANRGASPDLASRESGVPLNWAKVRTAANVLLSPSAAARSRAESSSASLAGEVDSRRSSNISLLPAASRILSCSPPLLCGNDTRSAYCCASHSSRTSLLSDMNSDAGAEEPME